MIKKVKVGLAVCLAVVAIGTGSVYAATSLGVSNQKPIINKTASQKTGIHKSSYVVVNRQNLLQLLHLTPDQFLTQLKEGKTIADIAKENKVTEQELMTLLTKSSSPNETSKWMHLDAKHTRILSKDHLQTKSKQGDGVRIIPKSQVQTKEK